AAVAEQLRVLLARALRFRRRLVDPLAALGKAVGGERRIGLDLVVEIDLPVEYLVLELRVRLGLARSKRRGKNDQRARKTESAPERGSCCVHENPRRRPDYSAASLWPSRALSLWISSSAASAITVPGGKIASAPALYSAS